MVDGEVRALNLHPFKNSLMLSRCMKSSYAARMQKEKLNHENSFLSFIKKSHCIFCDKVTMFIVMLIPMVLIVLFGFAISTEVTM